MPQRRQRPDGPRRSIGSQRVATLPRSQWSQVAVHTTANGGFAAACSSTVAVLAARGKGGGCSLAENTNSRSGVTTSSSPEGDHDSGAGLER
eukprot:scaffold26460_cov27-Tisochrysis_lutea.AAC.5